MNEKDKTDANGPHKVQPAKGNEPMSKPQWADSLRNMYDSVVDEPIPDSFKDLLAKLDEPEKETGNRGGET